MKYPTFSPVWLSLGWELFSRVIIQRLSLPRFVINAFLHQIVTAYYLFAKCISEP